MLRKNDPSVNHYALAIGLFVVMFAIFSTIKYFAGPMNNTVLVFFFLIVAAWYGGRGPGLLFAVLVDAMTIILNPPTPETALGRFVFGHVSILLLMITFVVVISSRKRAEGKLREQGELLRVTLSSIGDAVIATDVEGRINFINPTGETLTGWTQVEAAGKPLDEVFAIVDEQTREPVENSFLAIKREGIISGLMKHAILTSRDGKELPIGNSSAPIRDSDGKLVGAIIVFRDVSERRQAEQEREELLVGAQAARAEAETANRLKDEFLAMVSHELRTPLNAILGWAAMLRKRKPDQVDLNKGLGIIERNAKTQNGIISDILDVSRIVSGKLHFGTKPVDLISAIRAAVDTVFPAADAKSITITTSFADSDAIIAGDPDRLQQIFWNLISNAVKFTPRNGRIDIRLIKVDEEFEVLIRDNGVGISEKFLPFVFERFRQIDSSIKRTHGGLGLGLAIVKHLVELHGGSISAQSEGDGKGAVFSVKFPSANPAAATAPKVRETPHDLTGLRVLVVDDERDTLEVLCLMLEEQGAQTHGAATCAAAMEVFSDWKPDLIVSDLGMPGEDGFDLITRIRTLEPDEGGNTPAAALTAYVREEDCLDAIAAGYQMHIPKPVDPATLASAIADLAKYRSGPRVQETL